MLKRYIKDFFHDPAQELAFYEGLRQFEQSSSSKNTAIIDELDEIILDLKNQENSPHFFSLAK
jgi:hypothetical protein